jgi:HTH-type transcriptional regulator / antitoxin HigA
VGGKVIATVPEKYTLKNISTPTSITSEEQYDLYAETLLRLDSKSHLNHQEESYAKILMAFLEEWDEKHHPIRDASPIEVLTTLMEANNLRQKDLVPIFGTESIVSEVLSGKRELNVNHIRRLSHRFNLSPAVFIADRKAVPAPKHTSSKATPQLRHAARLRGR